MSFLEVFKDPSTDRLSPKAIGAVAFLGIAAIFVGYQLWGYFGGGSSGVDPTKTPEAKAAMQHQQESMKQLQDVKGGQQPTAATSLRPTDPMSSQTPR